MLLAHLIQAGYYGHPSGFFYGMSAGTMGSWILIIVIGIVGWIVQARLQSVFAKYARVPFPGGLTGAEVAEKDAARQRYPQREGHPCGGSPDRPFQSADDDRQSERLGLRLAQRRGGGRRGPRMRPRRAACAGIRSARTAFATGSDRQLLGSRRDVRPHRGHDPARHDRQCVGLLDRRGPDRRIGALLDRDASGRVQRFGACAGMARIEPHDAGARNWRRRAKR